MTCKVCVVGSINMDLVIRSPRFPRPGATVLGGIFEAHPGGKGANQAVAACRLGAEVTLVGCIGADDEGARMRAVLTSDGVDIHHLRTCEGARTGVAVITVVPGGDNTIVVAPGANATFTAEDVDRAAQAIGEADVLLLQAEIPVETNRRAVELARRGETRVILNAGPAENAPLDLLREVDVLVVNRGEAETILGLEEEVRPTGLVRRLATLGPESVVLTLGAEGAIHFDGQDLATIEALEVEAVDATAAGDAFVGALAVMRSEGVRVRDAVRFACAAGAHATTVAGANPSLPSREDVERRLAGAS